MPLPDAEPPEKSRLYEELKSKTALMGGSGAVTADLIDNLKNATFLDADNEDQLRRLKLLMEVTGTGSMSGPFPASVDVVTFTSTTSGTAVSVDQTGVWNNVGEIWKVYAPSLSVGGGSGSIQHELRLINDGRTVELLDFSTTGGSLRPSTEEGFIGGEIYVGKPAYLVYEATGTFTTAIMSLVCVRVR
jgi:hypothetical protein